MKESKEGLEKTTMEKYCFNCRHFDLIDTGWYQCNLSKELINESDSCEHHQIRERS